MDVQLEYKTFQWLANLLQESPKVDFDEWIEDGTVLCRAFNELVFNSVPFDLVDSPDVKASIQVATFPKKDLFSQGKRIGFAGIENQVAAATLARIWGA